MVQQFNKDQFEAALPKKSNWEYLGFRSGEFAYIIPVKKNVRIQIRSSIKYNRTSAPKGKDSIRAWLTNDDGEPISFNQHSYIQRTLGWEDRLTRVLRALHIIGNKLIHYCPHCNKPMSRKETKNSGKVFLSCSCNGKSFKWEDPEAVKKIYKLVNKMYREDRLSSALKILL